MAFYSLAAGLVLSFASKAVADCQSFGLDYVDGGSYFQNSNVDNTFTASQEFSGCTNDTSHNVLVDPNGDQTECSQTSMQPSNVTQTVTCDAWTNQNMSSGDWSILIISNNGNESAIAYQRDFHIDVGQPNATTSAAPTITNTVYATATQYSTTTVSTTTTSYLVSGGSSSSSASDSSAASSGSTTSGASTTSDASTTSSSTVTGGTTTGTDGTVTVTAYSATTDYATVTASCTSESSATSSANAWARSFDPIANTYPTILGALDQIASSIIAAAHHTSSSSSQTATPTSNSVKFKRAIIEGRKISEEAKRAFVEERASRLHPNGIVKRHPDSYTTTIVTSGGPTYTTESTSFVSTESYP